MPIAWHWPLESFSIAAKADLQRVKRLSWMLAQALVIERLYEAAEAAR